MRELFKRFNNDKSNEETNPSIVESVKEAAQDSGNEGIPADTIAVMTHMEGLADPDEV